MPDANAIRLRRLTPGDWQIFRALRLAALEEAPYAYSSVLADWRGENDSEKRWRARLTTVPYNAVAHLGGVEAGIAGGTTPDDCAQTELISMWVAPFARGRGVGDALVGAVVAWARAAGAARVSLRVLDGNAAAAALYERNGFCDDGAELAGERRLIRVLERGPLAIRPMRETDLPRVRAIDDASFDAADRYGDAAYRRMLDSPFSIVGDFESAPIGYVFVEGDTIRSIAVDPAHRRRGYGRALLRAAIERQPLGATLLVDEKNAAAVGLYESLGFNRIGASEAVPGRTRMAMRHASGNE